MTKIIIHPFKGIVLNNRDIFYGMTTQDVKNILGQPDTVSQDKQTDKNLHVETYQNIRFIFQKDRLVWLHIPKQSITMINTIELPQDILPILKICNLFFGSYRHFPKKHCAAFNQIGFIIHCHSVNWHYTVADKKHYKRLVRAYSRAGR